jgi:hypothetical protein
VVRVVRLTREIGNIEAGERDIPWIMFDVTIWTSVDINTGLFCASAPSLKPLLKRLVPGMLGSSRFSKKESGYAGGIIQSRRRAPDAFELSSQTHLGWREGQT